MICRHVWDWSNLFEECCMNLATLATWRRSKCKHFQHLNERLNCQSKCVRFRSINKVNWCESPLDSRDGLSISVAYNLMMIYSNLWMNHTRIFLHIAVYAARSRLLVCVVSSLVFDNCMPLICTELSISFSLCGVQAMHISQRSHTHTHAARTRPLALAFAFFFFSLASSVSLFRSTAFLLRTCVYARPLEWAQRSPHT